MVLLVYLLLAYVHQQKFGLVLMGLSALYFQRPLVASLLLQSWPLGFVAAANLLWAFALQVCFLGLYGCGTWMIWTGKGAGSLLVDGWLTTSPF